MTGLPYDKIVVPVDFSDKSLAAVDEAMAIGGDAASIHVIHVLAPIMATDPGVVWDVVDDESRRKHVLESLQARLSDDKYANLEMHVQFGDAGARITQYAEQIEADLIVIPSHGRTGLSRLFLGSVAERAIRLAHCHVLVLRD